MEEKQNTNFFTQFSPSYSQPPPPSYNTAAQPPPTFTNGQPYPYPQIVQSSPEQNKCVLKCLGTAQIVLGSITLIAAVVSLILLVLDQDAVTNAGFTWAAICIGILTGILIVVAGVMNLRTANHESPKDVVQKSMIISIIATACSLSCYGVGLGGGLMAINLFENPGLLVTCLLFAVPAFVAFFLLLWAAIYSLVIKGTCVKVVGLGGTRFVLNPERFEGINTSYIQRQPVVTQPPV